MIDFSLAIEPIYIVTIFFFIIGMQRMSHPLTARSGIVWAGAAMMIATLVTFLTPNLTNIALIAIAIVIGGGFGYLAAKRVAMTDMPQMIALFNGMGGGAAAGISAVALMSATNSATSSLAVIGGLIGAISFSGSMIAFMNLQGWMRPRPITFKGQQVVNMLCLALAIVCGILVIWQPSWMPAECRDVPFAVLCLLAGFWRPHDTPDRWGRHAGGNIDVQRIHRPCRSA